MRLPNAPLSRGAVSGLVLAGIVLLLMLLAPSVPLILFAAVLLAVFLNNCASWIAERTRLPMPLALTLTCVAIAAGFVLLGVVAAPVLADQAAQLWEQLPRAVQGLRTRLEAQSWGPALLERLSPGQLMESGGGAAGGGATAAKIATIAAIAAGGVAGGAAVVERADHAPPTPSTSTRSAGGFTAFSNSRYTPLVGHHGSTSAPILTRGAATFRATA